MPRQIIGSRPSWAGATRSGGPSRAGEAHRLERARALTLPGRLRLKGVVAALGAIPQGMAFATSSGYMYVALNSTSTVKVINPATLGVVTTISLTGGDGPWDVVYSPTQDRIYVTAEGASTVRVINPNTNTVVASVAVGSAGRTACFLPDTNHVAVANYGGSTVSFINCATGAVTTTTAVGANCLTGPGACLTAAQTAVLGVAHGLLLVGNLTANTASIIRTDTYAVLATWTVPSAAYPSGTYPYVPSMDPVALRLVQCLGLPGAGDGLVARGYPLNGNNADFAFGAALGVIYRDDVRRVFFGRLSSSRGIGGLATFAVIPYGPKFEGNATQRTIPPRAAIPINTSQSTDPGSTYSGACVNPVTGDWWIGCSNQTVEVIGT